MSQSSLKIRMKLQLISPMDWTSITTTPTCLFPPLRKAPQSWLPQRQCKLTTVHLLYREEVTGTSITLHITWWRMISGIASSLLCPDWIKLSRLLDALIMDTGLELEHRMEISDCQKWTSQCYLDFRIDKILEKNSPYFVQKVTLTIFFFINANPVHIYAVSLLN